MRPAAARAILLVAAAIVWFGLAVQFVLLAGPLGVGPAIIRFVGYFTLLSNLFVALVLTAHGFGTGGWLRSANAAGAAALYISVTGIVYELMLRAIWSPQGWQFVADLILHDVAPLLFVILWLTLLPKAGIGWSAIPVWLAFPLAFGAVAIARGFLEGFWAYPFLEVPALGAGRVAVNMLVMLAGFTALAALFVLLARRSRAPG